MLIKSPYYLSELYEKKKKRDQTLRRNRAATSSRSPGGGPEGLIPLQTLRHVPFLDGPSVRDTVPFKFLRDGGGQDPVGPFLGRPGHGPGSQHLGLLGQAAIGLGHGVGRGPGLGHGGLDLGQGLVLVRGPGLGLLGLLSVREEATLNGLPCLDHRGGGRGRGDLLHGQRGQDFGGLRLLDRGVPGLVHGGMGLGVGFDVHGISPTTLTDNWSVIR